MDEKVTFYSRYNIVVCIHQIQSTPTSCFLLFFGGQPFHGGLNPINPALGYRKFYFLVHFDLHLTKFLRAHGYGALLIANPKYYKNRKKISLKALRPLVAIN